MRELQIGVFSRRVAPHPQFMPASLPRVAWAVVFAVMIAMWFAIMDARVLQHPDEGRYAEIAREMVASGDWLTPRLNDLKYFEKPPLQYWITAAAFAAFAVDEWTARLWPALCGMLAVLVIGIAGRRIASEKVGLYSALALAAMLWHVGMSHIATLDSSLNFWLAAALAAFLVAQSDTASPRVTRVAMLLAWTATAGAVMTKGPVGLLIPGATLVAYSIVARDFAVWRRLHLLAGIAIVFVLCAPWFIAVSLANPEFAQFFFIHEHFQRYLTTTHNRTGAWWYFVPLFVGGVTPWLLVFLWTLRSNWRDAPPDRNGFSWQRFCLVWAGFVFLFFSASGSKLPSYILPMFPALALLIGWQLSRLSPRALYWLTLPHAVGATLLLLGLGFGFDALVARLANDRTPASIYFALKPWLLAALAAGAIGGFVALAGFRRGSPAGRSWGIVALAVGTLAGLQLALVGNDAFRVTRSAADILTAVQNDPVAPFDPNAPFYQVHSYDQTLPFYLGKPTPLVAFRDEFALGLDAEPHKGYPSDEAWIPVWMALPQGYAVMPRDDYVALSARGVSMRVVATSPRRVAVARR